jgi:hypothetical protein
MAEINHYRNLKPFLQPAHCLRDQRNLPWLRNSAARCRRSAATMVADCVRCWERTARLCRCATVRGVYSNSGTSFPTASNAPRSHAFTSASCCASKTPSPPAAPFPLSELPLTPAISFPSSSSPCTTPAQTIELQPRVPKPLSHSIQMTALLCRQRVASNPTPC